MRGARPARTDDELDRLVVEVLREESDWAKRADLVAKAGCRDNEFRAAVARRIVAGDPIATSMTRGYRWTTSPSDLEESAEEARTKVRALAVRAAAQVRTARRMRDERVPPRQGALFSLDGSAGAGLEDARR